MNIKLEMLYLKLGDLCPCDNIKTIKECSCLQPNNVMYPEDITITFGNVAPKKLENPKCFAKELNSCSNNISREHYISHSILQEIKKTYTQGEQLRVGGLPWQSQGALKEISPNSLASKMLCEHHNNSLSPLDTVGLRFFQAFQQIHNELHTSINPRKYYLFNGHNIERWMFKILCGIIAAGITTNIPKEARPPLAYLKALFYGEHFPETWGLYIITDMGKQQASGGIKVSAISNGNIVSGLIVEILAFRFILATHSVPKKEGILNNSVNRPSCLHLKSINSKKDAYIFFSWKIKGDESTININCGI